MINSSILLVLFMKFVLFCFKDEFFYLEWKMLLKSPYNLSNYVCHIFMFALYNNIEIKCYCAYKLLCKVCNSQSCAKEQLFWAMIYFGGRQCKSFYERIILSLGSYIHKAVNKDKVITVHLARKYNFSSGAQS